MTRHDGLSVLAEFDERPALDAERLADLPDHPRYRRRQVLAADDDLRGAVPDCPIQLAAPTVFTNFPPDVGQQTLLLTRDVESSVSWNEDSWKRH